MPFFADVILPLAIRGMFTYSIPDEFNALCQVGFRVVVPVGAKKRFTGIIAAIHEKEPEGFEVKSILDVLDTSPSVNARQLQLWRWMAIYYLCSLGEIYKAAVPSGLRLESETNVLAANPMPIDVHLTETEMALVALVQKNNQLTLDEIGKWLDVKNPIPTVKRLLEKGVLMVQEHLREKVKPKTERYLMLHPFYQSENSLATVHESLKRAKKQQQLLEQFIHLAQGDLSIKIAAKQLEKAMEGSAPLVRALLQKGILREESIVVSRIATAETQTVPKHSLNQHQSEGFKAILSQFEKLDTVLLHGVTSSGKTEVYIHLMEQVLEQGQQVLFLLPEIALTTQIISRLKRVFGNRIGIYHSRFSDAERLEIWNNLAANDEKTFKIILGVRSGVFLPFHNLGLIIVDEEHENTYKQFDPAPRYNARDLAVVLGKIHHAKVLMGSATPGIETYYNALSGRYGLVELTKRHQDIALPNIYLADVKKSHKKKEMQGHFTPLLLHFVRQAMEENKQVILFQNRRGYSPFLECKECGWVPKCKFCDVSLTYHKSGQKLSCHYCGYSTSSVKKCPVCSNTQIEAKGFGTEKIEDDMQILFPSARIGRLDLDTTQGKFGHLPIITAFEDQELDILIGTQMVSKGLDFEHVGVVGVLNADSMLSFPDFRAYERSYQLMAQVSGRAGRKHGQGTVIIQTRNVDHAIIKQVQDNNYQAMYEVQLAERRRFLYPPFSRLIELTLKHQDSALCDDAARYLVNELKKINGCMVLGPTTPFINRIQNKYIRNVLLKLSKDGEHGRLKNALTELFDEFAKHEKYKRITLSVDVDPM